jgi:hypothetical protein
MKARPDPSGTGSGILREVKLAVVAAALAIAGILVGSAAAERVVPQHRVARSGEVRADIYYEKHVWEAGISSLRNPRIRISRAGRPRFQERVPVPAGRPRDYPVAPQVETRDWFIIRDLDADGEPEVALLVNWAGTYCCSWSRIYRFDTARGTYAPVTHFWQNFQASPVLRDLDRDGRVEFISSDGRFGYLGPYVAVFEPVQIWSYDRGRFRDVTGRHPDQIRADAARIWRFYLRFRGRQSVRYVLAAWAADQYRLGRAERVDAVLADALRRGDLARRPGDFGGPPRTYAARLKRFLRKIGYIRA